MHVFSYFDVKLILFVTVNIKLPVMEWQSEKCNDEKCYQYFIVVMQNGA